jgi:hypothetical protein
VACEQPYVVAKSLCNLWWEYLVAAVSRKGDGSARKQLQGFHPVAAELIIPSQRREESERYICIETSPYMAVQNYSSIYVL